MLYSSGSWRPPGASLLPTPLGLSRPPSGRPWSSKPGTRTPGPPGTAPKLVAGQQSPATGTARALDEVPGLAPKRSGGNCVLVDAAHQHSLASSTFQRHAARACNSLPWFTHFQRRPPMQHCPVDLEPWRVWTPCMQGLGSLACCCRNCTATLPLTVLSTPCRRPCCHRRTLTCLPGRSRPCSGRWMCSPTRWSTAPPWRSARCGRSCSARRCCSATRCIRGAAMQGLGAVNSHGMGIGLASSPDQPVPVGATDQKVA